MRDRTIAHAGTLAVGVAIALVIGCAHFPNYAVPGAGGSPSPGTTPSPNPSSSPGSSPTPANCGTANPNSTIFVAMTGTATATNDPNYGVVNGYTDQYDQFNSPSNIANVIVAHPSDVIQFVNLEPLGPAPSPSASPSIINHSAAGFPGPFPSPSYTFPAQLQTQVGTVISTTQWSTGPIGQDFSNQIVCYSQSLTLPASAGKYYFGDLKFFGLTNTRDIVVVSNSAYEPEQRRHHPPFRRATPRPGAPSLPRD